MLSGCSWITCRASWIELFLNLFNHASDTLVHITGKLSTHIGELSTKTGATCSFYVYAIVKKRLEYMVKKPLQQLPCCSQRLAHSQYVTAQLGIGVLMVLYRPAAVQHG